MPQLDLSCLRLSPRHLGMLLALLEQHVPEAEVWAYGSRVVGGAQECSDLDLILRNRADLKQDVEGWFDLVDALQASTLPILVDVHLWFRFPQRFHRNIEAAYVVVYPLTRHQLMHRLAQASERIRAVHAGKLGFDQGELSASGNRVG